MKDSCAEQLLLFYDLCVASACMEKPFDVNLCKNDPSHDDDAFSEIRDAT